MSGSVSQWVTEWVSDFGDTAGKRQIFADAPGQTFYMTWDCVVSLAEMFEFLLLRKYLQFFMWRFVLFQLSYKMTNVFNKKKVICASSSQVCLPHLPFSQNLSMIKRRFGQILKSDLAQCHPHTSTVEANSNWNWKRVRTTPGSIDQAAFTLVSNVTKDKTMRYNV